MFADDISVSDISLGGAFEDAVITALTKVQNTYTLEFTFVKSGINLKKVKLEGSVTVAEGKIRNHWNTTLPESNTNLDYFKEGFGLNSYKEIKALVPAETGIFDKISSLCSYVGTVAGAAGGLKPIDNYLAMLSMYYNFYTESAKDIETTLTWLYSILSEGVFVATMAYNFTPSAQNDIVNKSFDKAAYQISKAMDIIE